jgi:hypothetical protein
MATHSARPERPSFVTTALLAAMLAVLAVIAWQGGQPPEAPLKPPCYEATMYEATGTYGKVPLDVSARLCPVKPYTAPTDAD